MSRDLVRLPGVPRAVRLLETAGRSGTETIVARAHELGCLHGAERHAAAERDSAVDAFRCALERLEAFGEAARRDLARTSVELALAISKRLLRTEVVHGNMDLEGVVREALQAASTERGACVVHLNPVDLEALSGVPFRAGTELRGDVEVARGDVHVETSLGLVVRELDQALDSIGERLLEELP